MTRTAEAEDGTPGGEADDDGTAADHGPAVRRLADWSAGDLRAVAGEFGTPAYLYDLDRVRENYRRFAAAFDEEHVYYAAKANTARAVLAALAEEGAGVECASAGEVRRALAAGFEPARLHYTAVNPPARDLDAVVETAADEPALTVTAGARDTVDRLAERGYRGRLCVRVNPGVGAGHHAHVVTGGNAKFGVPYDEAAAVVADARRRGFDVVGLHAHAGSGISGEDLSAHRELVARMGDLARTVGDLEFLDVGGGFGVPYRPDEQPLDLAPVAAATREAVGDLDADLAVEPGRYLVADAGVLLARVNTVKRVGGGTGGDDGGDADGRGDETGDAATDDADESAMVGVDAGMTDLLRPALYDAHHELRLLAPDAGERRTVRATVTGPICESGDVLAADRPLPDPARGDLLAVGNGGAYGFEMASQYNSRPRPPVVVRGDRGGNGGEDGDGTGDDEDGGKVRLARRRETIEDITATETTEVQR